MASAFDCTPKSPLIAACWKSLYQRSSDPIWHLYLFKWKRWGLRLRSKLTVSCCCCCCCMLHVPFSTNQKSPGIPIWMQFSFWLCFFPIIWIIKSLEDVVNFDFMEPPDRVRLVKSLRLLFLIGALDADGKLTPLGEQLVFVLVLGFQRFTLKLFMSMVWVPGR